MKIYLYIILAVFGVACSSTKKVETQKETKKKNEQDVKTVDLSYSGEINIYTGKRGKYKCEEHVKFKKEDWKNIVESGFSCVKDQNWTQLEIIADKISRNHLKAPWGPYYKSLVSSEKNNDYLRALWMCDLALKKSPKNIFVLFQQARIKWLMGEQTESYNLMKEVVKADPKNYEAFLFLANIHYRDRDYKKAVSFYKKVYKKFGRSGDYRASYAESLFFTGKLKESVKHYKVAVKKNKMNALLYYRLGMIYKKFKRWKVAKTYLDRSLDQRRKGRSIASLEDGVILSELKEVEKRIFEQKNKGKDDENKKKI